MLKPINLEDNPKLIKLVSEGEDFDGIPKEDKLLRWLNHHLDKTAYGKKVHNF